MSRHSAMACAIVIVLVGLGVALGYLIWGRQSDTIVEGYAHQVNMDDGSVVLSREPDGKPDVPEPAHPAGTKVTRTIEATVSGGKPVQKPDTEPNTACLSAQDFTCPPVTVRIDLLRDKHGTYRAQVSSNAGEVLDGVDIPREPVTIAKRLPWAIGYQRDLDGVHGVYLTRDIGRIEVGASITQGATAQARIGWRF